VLYYCNEHKLAILPVPGVVSSITHAREGKGPILGGNLPGCFANQPKRQHPRGLRAKTPLSNAHTLFLPDAILSMRRLHDVNEEDAFKYIVSSLRNRPILKCASYGYDVYLPGIIRHYVEHHEGLQDHQAERCCRELSPHFYAAAWELCRRGIVRPGIRLMGEQSTPDGSAGNGYSITPFGYTWIAESDRDDFVPTEPGHFAKMLEPFRSRMGPGFYERAQQAVRCYGAHAYLACCAMCGAAAESILLALAIAKDGEEKVLNSYRSVQGRSRVEKMVLGQVRQQLETEFRGYTTLLKYWRDEAAHGRPSGISDNEAYTSLSLLLRFAHFSNDHWAELTVSGRYPFQPCCQVKEKR